MRKAAPNCRAQMNNVSLIFNIISFACSTIYVVVYFVFDAIATSFNAIWYGIGIP